MFFRWMILCRQMEIKWEFYGWSESESSALWGGWAAYETLRQTSRILQDPPGSSSLTAVPGSHSLPGPLCLFHVLSWSSVWNPLMKLHCVSLPVCVEHKRLVKLHPDSGGDRVLQAVWGVLWAPVRVTWIRHADQPWTVRQQRGRRVTVSNAPLSLDAALCVMDNSGSVSCHWFYFILFSFQPRGDSELMFVQLQDQLFLLTVSWDVFNAVTSKLWPLTLLITARLQHEDVL